MRDSAVLDAVETVDRRRFLPEDAADLADVDAALALSHGQTTSQPSLIAVMVQALQLTPGSRVLEVGTGSGYEAAVLARLAAEVWTVERIAALGEIAAANLADQPHVHVLVGDGALGAPAAAPFDAVVVAAQTETVPAALVEQLRVGGRLVAPVGGSSGQRCWVGVKGADGLLHEAEDLGPVLFVPLVRGADDRDAETD